MDSEGVPPPVNMALPTPVWIEDSILEKWVLIGAGAFGQIYKARHKRWCYDVAIKLLHKDDGTCLSLLREVEMMLQGSNEYVMQVLGVFRGRPPNSGSSAQLGLVMKYMEKGTLESLQEHLDGVPPLPLVFRLAHQVAQGINFLHSLSPPILHRDLKPSNVLLDSDLNVKLTDFGLSKISQTLVSKKDLEDGAGTISYMPPEAFKLNYKPSRAFDIYSYGILLWSIATGEQPYPNATPRVVMFQIPKGQRPSLEELTVRAADQEELRRLMELMEKCWETSPTHRPSSFECTNITEKLYERHEHGIIDAVHEVLKKLREQKEQDKLTEDLQRLRVTPAKGSPRDEAVKNQDHVKTGPPPVQEVAPRGSANQRVKDPHASQQANVSDGDTTRSSTDDHEPKASSVHPIGESPAPPSTGRSPQASAAKNPLQPFQRQFSSPTPSTIQPTRYVCIHCGNNNTLYINKEPSERKQHPTAPSRVNPPSPHPGSSKNIIAMELEGVLPPVIENSVLTGWEWIGSGAFGEIYKARHQGWCSDVAIKLLHNYNTQTHEKRIQALQRQVQMMLLGSSEYVMQVLGIFNGRPPNSGPSAQLGLVMKYMEKGSLASLQNTLDGVPPLPLVFRLAHQVALGMNFLHSLSPPILHLNLKPNNVLLDSDLNVKLTGFGLSKPSQTQTQVSKTDKEDVGGTISYMPPEAFGLNYKPSRAYDIYSYGILLWSIATGKQPYRYASPHLVQLRIPKGDRPSLDELSNKAELRGLVELIKKCWETSSTQRPSSLECSKITEELYERHEHGIIDAVHEVLKKLREQKERDRMT